MSWNLRCKLIDHFRSNNWRLLSAASDNRWWSCIAWHPRYSRAGWIYSYEGPIHEVNLKLKKNYLKLIILIYLLRCGEGFIICYSICDRHSFQEASEYRKLIARVRLTEDIPLVLVANKLDLQSQRCVSIEEGKALAMQFGCPFYETSAALRCNVDEVFYALVREIRRKEMQKVRKIINIKLINNFILKYFYKSLTNDASSEKIRLSGRIKQSKWLRLRSIFALVFKRNRSNWIY